MDALTNLKCPVCGEMTLDFEQYGPRPWGGKNAKVNVAPAGETVGCDNQPECGFYVEVNRQNVLLNALGIDAETGYEPDPSPETQEDATRYPLGY